MEPLHLLIVDEAAQLKECESPVPLQLPGISHAVLIGDECQLPATIKSMVRLWSFLFRRCFDVYFLTSFPFLKLSSR